MDSIVIVGMNKDYCKTLSNTLAKIFNFKYVDAESEFENLLINSFDHPMMLVDDILREKETEFLTQLSKLTDVVIYLADDTYLSNEHYKIFKNFNTILVETNCKNKILKNIQNLLKKYCKFSVNEQNLNIDELKDLLKG